MDDVNADEAWSASCALAPVKVMEFHRQLESTDLRLSAAESSLRELRDSMQIWTAIIQDGLADLSVQVKVAPQHHGSTQPMHLSHETGDDSNILSRLLEKTTRLLEVDQQVRATHAAVRETPELFARIHKAERLLQELEAKIQDARVNHLQEMQAERLLQEQEAKIQEVRVKHLHETQDSHDKLNGTSHMRGEIFSRVEKTASKSGHLPSVPDSHFVTLDSATHSRSQQSMRNSVLSKVNDPVVASIVDAFRKHSQQLQHLPEGPTPPVQVQTQQSPQGLGVGVSPRQQDRQPFSQRRQSWSVTIGNPDHRASCITSSVPHTTRQTSLSPRQHFRIISPRYSYGAPSVQRPGTLGPPYHS
jgi:hypothetical protein